MQEERRLSLVELSETAAPLSPSEVAAIVTALCRLTPAGDVAARATTTLGPEDVWLDAAGTAHLAPGAIPTVSAIGALLEPLVAEVRRGGPARFPPGLILIAGRATGRIDSAPFPSPEALGSALARFEPPDAGEVLRSLFERADTARRQAAHRPAVAAEPSRLRIVDKPNVAIAAPVVRAPRARRARAAAVALVALAAAFAAGVLSGLYVPTNRITDATDVIVQPRAADTVQPTEPTPQSASPRRTIEREPPATRLQRSAPAPSQSREAPTATSGTAPDAPSRGELGSPQPLVGPTDADSDKVFSPSFNQSGSAVFFHAETAAGSALKRAEPGDNGVLHVVTILDDKAKNYHVQLSPDGGSVAFDSDRDGVRGVYVAQTDGTRVRRVSGEGYAAVPTWSPDGRRLAFLRAERDRPSVWNLWLLDLASREMTRLTNHAYGQVWSASWFPNGQRLAYSHEDQLILLDLGTGRRMSYASPLKGRLVRTPAVSPDGNWIVFQVFRDGGWLLNLDNGSMRRVLDDASAEEFTWSPDGSRVAFHSRRRGDWGLWMMSAR
jgi:hypothetical protein